MTQALSGGAIALVLVVFWLLGRPKPKLMRSTDGSSVAALNRAQMELVQSDSGAESPPPPPAPAGPEAGTRPVQPGATGMAPRPEGPGASPLGSTTAGPARPLRSGRDSHVLLASLKAAYALGGSHRRQALETCLAWGHRAALPLLHRGLRDADPVVVALAARGLDRFRGRSGAGVAPPQVARLPRNVARTR